MVSPANEARRGPLRVWKVSGAVPSTTPFSRSACAEANVAWPHRSISTAGENQRRPKTIGSSVGREVRRLGDAELEGDGLHAGVVERLVEEADGGGVPPECHLAEGVDPGERDAHGAHNAKRASASARTSGRLQKAQRTSVRPASASAGS